MGEDSVGKSKLSRREILLGGAAIGFAAASPGKASPTKVRQPDLLLETSQGLLKVTAMNDRAFRVVLAPLSGGLGTGAHTFESQMLLPQMPAVKVHLSRRGTSARLEIAHAVCEVDTQNGQVRLFDKKGNLLLSETAGGRTLERVELSDGSAFAVSQSFESGGDERIFGTGCFQDGALNIRRLPRRLTQVNTQISLPFVISNKGYGLLWNNPGMSEFNTPTGKLVLEKVDTQTQAQSVDVTTTAGNARITRQGAAFEGKFTTEKDGDFAFLMDIGRKMASRHCVEIDGVPCVDFTNQWLPPTTSFLKHLPAGEHRVSVLANDKDAPVLYWGAAQDRTQWRSPVATALDYVVIAGPDADGIMAGYRQLCGETPLFPLWAYGYIHCRERFSSQAEIVETALEFRRRKLPVDVMVQDWQYWGKYGWNAMRFDEDQYPDPAGMVKDLHALNARLMVSVWAKLPDSTQLGKEAVEKGYIIPGTEWVDFFNAKASAFYTENQNKRLATLGIDAWWQDATEPENDDLEGRMTAAGAGERVRNVFPLQITQAVYDSQRQFAPDRRVMILTRSAAIGQQRYAAATWSGDIGNDWETLKRQIPAGLNMAAAGYPYWTVDGGGFFRPGEGQYTDTAYHERFLRWFQYCTFLPLQRVHGYQTKTEFWRFGETVETVSRTYLELRYRLLPYIYSAAGETWRTGVPMLRPLVFDFRHEPKALEESHTYMFGRALHVAPVLAEGVTSWPVYLPENPGGWYDFWTGEHREGGKTYDVPAPVDRLPLHVKAGTILPMGPVMQSTAEVTDEEIDLHVFPGQDGHFTLYEDAGLDYGYEKGRYSLIDMTWENDGKALKIGSRMGQYKGMSASRRFNVSIAAPGTSSIWDPQRRALDYHGRSTRLILT